MNLRPPSPEEFATWSAAQLDAYIDEIVESGTLGREAAEQKGRADLAELLPEGLATPGQSVFRVEADGQAVGWLWLALRNPRGEAGVGFIYDISVDDDFRGRGYGRGAMLLAEEEARRHGLRGLALNVFGQNKIARALYSSLGYSETSVQMKKEL